MTGLYIVLGIILFFVVLFSFKVSVIVEMTNKNKVVLKYLFLKFTLLDSSKPEKEKKPKNKKKEKNKTEDTSAETTDTTPTENTTDNNVYCLKSLEIFLAVAAGKISKELIRY